MTYGERGPRDPIILLIIPAYVKAHGTNTSYPAPQRMAAVIERNHVINYTGLKSITGYVCTLR